MRKILVLLTLVLVGYIAVNRQRIYLRDPLGRVVRGGVKVEGARVFINYSNDVLVQIGDGPRVEEFLVQGWNGVPETPTELQCLQGMACLAAADHAPGVSLAEASMATMSSRQVSFEQKKLKVQVVLR